MLQGDKRRVNVRQPGWTRLPSPDLCRGRLEKFPPMRGRRGTLQLIDGERHSGGVGIAGAGGVRTAFHSARGVVVRASRRPGDRELPGDSRPVAGGGKHGAGRQRDAAPGRNTGKGGGAADRVLGGRASGISGGAAGGTGAGYRDLGVFGIVRQRGRRGLGGSGRGRQVRILPRLHQQRGRSFHGLDREALERPVTLAPVPLLGI